MTDDTGSAAPGSYADDAAEAAAEVPGPELRVGRITVYPIKSLDGVEIDAAAVLPSGALAWDRRFALFSPDGTVVNGKVEPRIHRAAAAFDLSGERVTVGPRTAPTSGDDAGVPGPGSRTFSLHDEREELEAFLSRLLARPVRLREDLRTGFPDDAASPGPTVVTAATLSAVADWFELTPAEMRRRFRANFELTARHRHRGAVRRGPVGARPGRGDRVLGRRGSVRGDRGLSAMRGALPRQPHRGGAERVPKGVRGAASADAPEVRSGVGVRSLLPAGGEHPPAGPQPRRGERRGGAGRGRGADHRPAAGVGDGGRFVRERRTERPPVRPAERQNRQFRGRTAAATLTFPPLPVPSVRARVRSAAVSFCRNVRDRGCQAGYTSDGKDRFKFPPRERRPRCWY